MRTRRIDGVGDVPHAQEQGTPSHSSVQDGRNYRQSALIRPQVTDRAGTGRKVNFCTRSFTVSTTYTSVAQTQAIGNLALYTGSVVITAIVQVPMVVWITWYAYKAVRLVYGSSPAMTILKGLGICVVYGLIALPLMVAGVLIAAS